MYLNTCILRYLSRAIGLLEVLFSSAEEGKGERPVNHFKILDIFKQRYES